VVLSSRSLGPCPWLAGSQACPIGFIYGCGLAAWKPVQVARFDFDRKQLKVVQGKGKKRPLQPLSISFDTRIKKIHCSRKPNRLSFNGQPIARSGRILTVVAKACNGGENCS
jgi:integrase